MGGAIPIVEVTAQINRLRIGGGAKELDRDEREFAFELEIHN